MVLKYSKIVVNIPEQLLKDFDQICERNYYSRPEGIKQALREWVEDYRYLNPTKELLKERYTEALKAMADAGMDLEKDQGFQDIIKKQKAAKKNIQ